MERVILIRYSEIHLKGKNKGFFVKTLKQNIEKAVEGISCNITFTFSRLLITDYDTQYEQDIVNKVKVVFGVHSLSVTDKIKASKEKLYEYFKGYNLQTKTFKVETKRANKNFEMTSPEVSSYIGGIILDNNKDAIVDVHNPETTVNIDIREHNNTYIFDNVIKAYSGMPVGVSGKGLALLSGGIDSPVAIFKIASRGMRVDAVHFHSFPYTSEQAKEKVLDLAKILTKYVGNMRVFVVPFTSIQEHINKQCNEEYMVTLMRRFMVKIAEKIALNKGHQAIITGENLAQVASQTVESLTSTDQVVKSLPIFRPLIANNKEEIVSIAKQIGTYKTSIQPYEDCCTVFLPKNPLIKPKLRKVALEENKLQVDELINEAIDNLEVVDV
jgi:thiamine biosynthesis protein ThiI